MSGKKILFLALFPTISILPACAHANSSWIWISIVRPWDLLPITMILTIVVECFILIRYGKAKDTLNTFVSVCIANLFSFLLPYLLVAYRLIRFWGYSFQNVTDKPFFTVGSTFLFITLLAEVPVTYLLLQKHCRNKVTLVLAVLTANLISTCLTALMERLFCHGQW